MPWWTRGKGHSLLAKTGHGCEKVPLPRGPEELSKDPCKDENISCEVRAREGAGFVWNTLGREHEAENREAGIKGLSGLSKV